MPRPIRMGDELWIYYSDSNRDHDGIVDPEAHGHLTGIGRAVMRLDGFVSADAAYSGGEMVTPVMRQDGSLLCLNLDSGGGSIPVELQDADGRPFAGRSETDASFICGNSVGMPVSCGESRSVSDWAGKPVRLRFVMRDCKLYSFRFCDPT